MRIRIFQDVVPFTQGLCLHHRTAWVRLVSKTEPAFVPVCLLVLHPVVWRWKWNCIIVLSSQISKDLSVFRKNNPLFCSGTSPCCCQDAHKHICALALVSLEAGSLHNKSLWAHLCNCRTLIPLRCQTYDPWAKTGPSQGPVRPVGWICEIQKLHWRCKQLRVWNSL